MNLVHLALTALMQVAASSPSAPPRLPDEALVDLATRGTVRVQCGQEPEVLALAIAGTSWVVPPPAYALSRQRPCLAKTHDGSPLRVMRVFESRGTELIELATAPYTEGLLAADPGTPQVGLREARLADGNVVVSAALGTPGAAIVVDGDGRVHAMSILPKQALLTAETIRQAVIAARATPQRADARSKAGDKAPRQPQRR